MREVRRFLPVAALLVASACVQPVSPARTYEEYESKARDTAQTTLGAIQTVRVAIDVEDDLIPPYVSVLIADAEGDASGAQATFDGVQPPGARADRVREELDPLLEQATGVLADARITARRAELDALHELDEQLQRIAGRLDRFIEEHGK
jgi:hypothetical protein